MQIQVPELYELVILALGVFRLSRLVTTDQIFEPLRNAIWKWKNPSTQIGYLFTCNWCMSIWASSLTLICYTIVPTATLLFCTMLALSAVAGIISTKLDK